ncbi:MAG: hypothetical protein MK116_07675 [Phycisphaerales bacterium]|nr:hypothetical protein [Phycisphaerales bacterium]
MTTADHRAGRRSSFGTVSLGMGIILWLIQIVAPLVGMGMLGASFKNMASAGTASMPEDQMGAFVIMIIMGAAGLAAIVGFIYGILGFTTSDRGQASAIIGAVMNAMCWIWAAVFFIFVASY